MLDIFQEWIKTESRNKYGISVLADLASTMAQASEFQEVALTRAAATFLIRSYDLRLSSICLDAFASNGSLS